MTIYYCLLTWMLFCSLVTEKFEVKYRRVIQFLFCTIPAVLISAIRSPSVGTDTMQYIHAVQLIDSYGYDYYIDNGGMYSSYEPGFIFLLRFCCLFADPVLTLLVVSSVLIVGVQYFVIFRLCSRPVIVYILLFLVSQYYFGLTGMRQAIAATFVLSSVAYSLRNRRMISLLLLGIAVSFHYTSLIALPILLLYKTNITKKIVNWIILSVCLIVIVGPSFIYLFSIFDKYSGYLSTGQEYLISGRMMPLIQICYFSVMLCSLLHSYFRSCRTDSYLVNMKKIGILASFAGLLIGISSLYINLFYRFMYVLLPLVIVSAVENSSKQHKVDPYLRLITYISCLFMFVSFLFVNRTWFGIDPYILNT